MRYSRSQLLSMARATINAAKAALGPWTSGFPTSGNIGDWVHWGQQGGTIAQNAATAALQIGSSVALASLRRIGAQLTCFNAQAAGQPTQEPVGSCSIFTAGPGGGTTVPAPFFVHLVSSTVQSADSAVTAAEGIHMGPVVNQGYRPQAMALRGPPQRRPGFGASLTPAQAATDATTQLTALTGFFAQAATASGAVPVGTAQTNLASLQSDVNAAAGSIQGFSVSKGQAALWGLGLVALGVAVDRFVLRRK